MRSSSTRILTLALLLLPALAFAAGGHGDHGGEVDLFKKVGIPAINFVLYIAVLVFFLAKPLKAFFAKRRDEIAARLESAEKLKRDAEAKYKEYEDKLKALEDEGARILEEARAEGEAEKQRLIESAKVAAARVTEDARRRVEAEVRAARIALRKEAVAEAVQAARQILEQQLTPADDQKLMQATVSQVEKLGGHA